MAEGTVKTHLHTIYQVLKVRSRAQAILKARDLNLL
jgi:ATP/maltotriose-dependent transcriptional regulator MalT